MITWVPLPPNPSGVVETLGELAKEPRSGGPTPGNPSRINWGDAGSRDYGAASGRSITRARIEEAPHAAARAFNEPRATWAGPRLRPTVGVPWLGMEGGTLITGHPCSGCLALWGVEASRGVRVQWEIGSTADSSEVSPLIFA